MLIGSSDFAKTAVLVAATALQSTMGNSFRSQPMPTRYGEMKTPVTEDVLQVGLLYAFGIITASFILIIPGIRGWERLWASIRVFVALWIGAVLLVCNFGSWYADSICTSTQYKAHTKLNTPQAIQATVGISISLRGINITLSEREEGCGAETYERPFPGEAIHYVESFRWAPSWRQGRIDFGEYGGQYSQRYRVAEFRGMPYPILWVAETFLLDGEQYRWYRKFRVAGWYTHIFMWLGFATYLASIILFIINIRLGAYFMLLTGVILCLASLTYGVLIQNDPPLRIHFPDDILRPNFNYSFYLTVATGGVTTLLACVILLIEKFSPRKTATIFHHTVIEEDTIFENALMEDAGKNYIKNKRFSTRTIIDEKTHRRNTLVHNRPSLISIRSDVIPRMKSTFEESPGCSSNSSPDVTSSVPLSPATSVSPVHIHIQDPTPISSVPTPSTPDIAPVATPDPTPTTPDITPVPTPTSPDSTPPAPPTTPHTPAPRQVERAEKGTQVMLELVPLRKRIPVEV